MLGCDSPNSYQAPRLVLLASIPGPLLRSYAVQVSGTAFHTTVIESVLSLQAITNIPHAMEQINDSDRPEYFLFKLMRSKGILNDAKRAKPMLTGLSLKNKHIPARQCDHAQGQKPALNRIMPVWIRMVYCHIHFKICKSFQVQSTVLQYLDAIPSS